MSMIISIDHGATLLPACSPVIAGLRSAPDAADGVSGPPLWPDIGLPGRAGLKLLALAAALTPSLPEPPAKSRKSRKHRDANEDTEVEQHVAEAAPAPQDTGTDDPSYDEAVEKLLWYLVVG